MFGDTGVCLKCVDCCYYCGIHLSDKNRVLNMCTTCVNYGSGKGICCICDKEIEKNDAYYKQYGNYCPECSRDTNKRRRVA